MAESTTNRNQIMRFGLHSLLKGLPAFHCCAARKTIQTYLLNLTGRALDVDAILNKALSIFVP